MIVLDVKIDNYYAFDDFRINFSYKKKDVKQLIENEFLSYCPTFRYKKFVMLMGANATGKTTFGKMLMSIFNFITRKEYSHIVENINNKTKKASFSMDFICDDKKMYRIETIVEPMSNNAYESSNIKTRVTVSDIVDNDTYEKCVAKIEKQKIDFNSNYVQELEKIYKISWIFRFSRIDSENKNSNEVFNQERYELILQKTLMSLDPRIIGISKIEKNIYVIKYPYRNVIMENGEVNDNTLSSGTKEGIDIAYLVSSIKGSLFKFYFCDEKFSYVHSEMEKSFISLMIDCLHDDEQLIMTTHNSDILQMNLPKHSFAFLRRNADLKIESVFASDYLKRNTDSVKSAAENDVFGTIPDIDAIYKLKKVM